MSKEILKIQQLLSLEHKKRGLYLIGVLVVAIFFEAIGIGLIFPILSIMINGQQPLHIFGVDFQNFGFENIQNLAFLLVFFLFLKFIILNYASYIQANFIFSIENYLSVRLFNAYLSDTYAEFHNIGAIQVMHKCQSEMNALRTDALIPTLLVISEGLAMAGIGLMLIIFDPISTIILAAIFFAATIFLRLITKQKIYKWGVERKKAENHRARFLLQILNLYDFIKIRSKQKYFLNRYQKIIDKSSAPGIKQLAIQSLPRLFIEFFIVIALIILVLIFYLRGGEHSIVVPTIAVFAAAGFRIMPSINRFYSGLQNLQYSQSIITDLYQKINPTIVSFEEDIADSNINFQGLEFNNVSYGYNNNNNLLNSINLKINVGDYLGIIGESGSGKSTILKLILGFLQPKSGNIDAAGFNFKRNLDVWHSILGYVPQDVVLFDGTVSSNIALGIDESHVDVERVWQCLSIANLSKRIGLFPKGIHEPIDYKTNFSGGEKQRMGIARALYHDPKILLFDEATSSLDEVGECEILDLIDQLRDSVTIISITHRRQVISRCDIVYELRNGALEKIF